MIEQSDVTRGRAVVERWCILAEQRLEYLTELFETGRWRRYHSELDFLDNIQEAKLAVQTWRGLLTREATANNQPVDLSWLGVNSKLKPRQSVLPSEAPATWTAPRHPAAVQYTAPVAPVERTEPVAAAADEDAAEPVSWERQLDLVVMQQRYPLLRPAL
ncbi:TIGR03809 family protein [Rhodopseudomonas palustris]|uniref:TIGR03809 family protein n=1 Tax=Rhodopseudomonas palustris (strain BisB18) TaxID=316056 RepID=Q217Y0_RHOPB